MKKIITAFIFCFLIGKCFSQAGEWVWIKGDSIANQPGNFGVQGVPSPTNCPPALYEPCEWTDLNGNFWLFGGMKITGDTYGALWKYDPLTNEWTWMKGSNILNYPGNYGIQGVSSPTNTPPARKKGITSWVDNQGNFWMFGGTNFNAGDYNDLWKYNVSSNEWTWIKGPNQASQPGIYGTQGIPNPNNLPWGRYECAASWTDTSSNLWLFGGLNSSNIVNRGCYNDLWRFNIVSNEWTWMKGNNFPDAVGVYGILGTEDTLNSPGARASYSHWKDYTGKFWLFGGVYIDSSTSPFHYNDLWRYNPYTNNWAWMKGDSITNVAGDYGTKCISSLSNTPGSRFECRASWSDQNNNFWFFGGGKGIMLVDTWNDLWMYCVSTNQWRWVNGDSTLNPTGNWGTIGISSPFNKHNGRAGAVGWTDNNGHLYLFGGMNFNLGNPLHYNDLWKYTIDTTCGVCPTSTGIEELNFINELLIFPNPTNSSLTISFSSSEKQNIELRLYNTLANQIYFSKEEITKGKFEKEINMEKLGEGIYFLQVKTKDGTMSRKVIVSHP